MNVIPCNASVSTPALKKTLSFDEILLKEGVYRPEKKFMLDVFIIVIDGQSKSANKVALYYNSLSNCFSILKQISKIHITTFLKLSLSIQAFSLYLIFYFFVVLF